MIGVLIDAIADIRFRETFLFVFPACDLKGFLASSWDFFGPQFWNKKLQSTSGFTHLYNLFWTKWIFIIIWSRGRSDKRLKKILYFHV